ncbi:MAG TPA: glycoside hydrolase family 13 protein [Pseudolysinimonas sp.]|nr:glycoside hydrolase family 13 protein [Pseudolysinimonas sp.]
MTDAEWWRSAVIYQVYPRSFADSTGDGVGDLAGITPRLPALADLGVDAVWLSPFMTSPQKDAGYDVADYCDVDPLFGSLADFDAMRDRARSLGLKVIIDLVPNHTSTAHRWFTEALAAGPGSPERDRYLFRPGLGETGELPPNNWQSVFGGPAWTRITEADGTPGPWYLHLFDSSQPDLDWTNPWVHDRFREILRFWLDRGVDGFRVDVAHGLIKESGLPDYTPDTTLGAMDPSPFWAQEDVHDIYRDWHRVLAEYGTERILVAEAWVLPLTRLANWVRPDEMQQAFNFGYLSTDWNAAALRVIVDDSLAAFEAVDAPSTWVLSNHDVIRHATRFGLNPPPPQGTGIGPLTVPQPDVALGLQRARAATAFMLALPGSAYLYQGEELGLPEVIHLPDSARQDPTFARTAGKIYGRDGCRVPIPWEAALPAAGFSPSGESWLPQPAGWPGFARDVQLGVEGSTLELYRSLLTLRREHGLGTGHLQWHESGNADVLQFEVGGVTVLANTGAVAVALPAGRILVASGSIDGGLLPGDTTVWLIAD